MNKKSTLLAGEPMALFIAKNIGRLEDAEEFLFATCGAEFNVAVGFTRLGHKVSYLTKLGRDPFGRRIVKMMEQTGISTDMILYSDTAPTGFMFKSGVEEGDPDIFYFRKGSAASTLSPKDMEIPDYSKYDLIHVTGIMPALSASARAATDRLLEKAKENNIFFSFDPNLRPSLWPSREEMACYINKIAFESDLFLPGINEARTIMGESDPEKIASFYLNHGTGTVIVKLGAAGAYYANSDERGHIPGFEVKKIVDTVGAGDGFAAGVLTALKERLPLAEAVRRGCAIGAIQLMSKGDNDGLPTAAELKKFMQGDKNWR